jgi:hypothetical protein
MTLFLGMKTNMLHIWDHFLTGFTGMVPVGHEILTGWFTISQPVPDLKKIGVEIWT